MVPAELVNEDWYLVYAGLVNNPVVKLAREPRIVKTHPSLSANICGGEDLEGVEIVKTEWGHKIVQSEEEIRQVGRES